MLVYQRVYWLTENLPLLVPNLAPHHFPTRTQDASNSPDGDGMNRGRALLKARWWWISGPTWNDEKRGGLKQRVSLCSAVFRPGVLWCILCRSCPWKIWFNEIMFQETMLWKCLFCGSNLPILALPLAILPDPWCTCHCRIVSPTAETDQQVWEMLRWWRLWSGPWEISISSR